MKTWLTLVLALFMLGCGSSYMAPVQAPHTVAVDGANATVVFIRPSSYGGGEPAVLDHQGNYYGSIPGDSYMVVTVPPGDYTFIAWSEGTPALHARLAPGKLYYIEMGMTIGAWSARARLFGIGPNRKQWSELPEWLAESQRVEHAPGGRQKFMADKGDEIHEVVQKGLANWADYDAEARQQRSLTPADAVAVPIN